MPINPLNIAVVQSFIHWENPEMNIVHLEKLFSKWSRIPDLVMLPEMFSTGFSMRPHAVAETETGPTLSWMISKATSLNCAIAGSLPIREGDFFYNRFYFVFPSGNYDFYDKRHLFTLVGEDKTYTSGQKQKVVEYLGWKLCLQVCYDLRFPVFSRNSQDYDALLYVANWPKPRIHAWDTLLRARAIENVSYCIGVNRVGEDANGHEYPGHSQVWDALGNELLQKKTEEGVFEVTLNHGELQQIREKFPFLKDKDEFTILGLVE